MADRPTKITGLAGSLRKRSYNKTVLKHLVQHAPGHVDFSIHDLKYIPLFNADVEEHGDPEEVEDLKEAIEEADGLIIATPEYSHGMPGVLKNALDWAASETNVNVLAEKPVFVLGASPSPLGTAFSQMQVKQTLHAAGALVLSIPEVYIGHIQKKIDAGGSLTDEKTIDLLSDGLDAFLGWIEKWKI